MYEVHPKLSTPDDSQVIWRYFDLTGFLSLISSNSLYFCRCDKFEDRWDGLYSDVPDLLAKYPPTTPENVAILRRHMGHKELVRTSTFANCWHMNTDESAAMWEIYTARNNGIAISTTVGKLKTAFRKCSRPIWISKVIYGDFAVPDLTGHQNALPPLFVKRKEYEFEKEVRALVWNHSGHAPLAPNEHPIGEHDPGFLCPIDLYSLMDNVIIAPKVRSGFVPIVQSILDKFGMDHVKARHSRLADEPLDLDDHDPKIYNLSLRMDGAAIEMLLAAWLEYEQKFATDRKLYDAIIQIQIAIKTAASSAGYAFKSRP